MEVFHWRDSPYLLNSVDLTRHWMIKINPSMLPKYQPNKVGHGSFLSSVLTISNYLRSARVYMQGPADLEEPRTTHRSFLDRAHGMTKWFGMVWLHALGPRKIWILLRNCAASSVTGRCSADDWACLCTIVTKLFIFSSMAQPATQTRQIWAATAAAEAAGVNRLDLSVCANS